METRLRLTARVPARRARNSAKTSGDDKPKLNHDLIQPPARALLLATRQVQLHVRQHATRKQLIGQRHPLTDAHLGSTCNQLAYETNSQAR